MKRLKIGLFVDTYYPMIDGVVKVVDNYATILSKDADVFVFAPKPRQKDYVDAFPYRVIRSNRIAIPFADYDLPTPKKDRVFLNQLYALDLDIVHIHSPYGLGKIGIEYAKKKNIPSLSTLHSQYHQDFIKRTKSKLISKLLLKNVIKTFNKTDHLFAVNQKIAHMYRDFGLKSLPKVLSNGTDFNYVEPDFVVNKLRSIHKITEDEKVLLFVGRIDKIKNIFFLLDTLLILKQKDFKFKMFYVGSGPDIEKLKRKVKRYEMEDMVKVIGKVTDRDLLANYYKLADLFVFPSIYDTSSLVQIEAASQKTPTLFIENTVTASNISDNINGYLCKHNKNEYAKKIISILSDTTKNKEISQKAYDDLFVTWDHILDDVIEIYKRVDQRKNLNEVLYKDETI